MVKEAIELSQKNYEGLLPIFRDNLPAFSRIVPVEKELVVPQEVTLPSYEASKIIDQHDVISLSECPCKLERTLLDDPCKATDDRFKCFHFGNLGRFFIEHGYGKPVSKENAKKIIKVAEDEGLVHKIFHDEFDLKNEWTVWKAAEYCDESYRSFLHILREANVPFPISTQELERELNESSGK
ncbi:unnamed protein product [marine sediment metagenome]|uniref:Uncharacterized protein n=1 Tax=marine sediment metagenome TaxID=412755 RepID=X1UVS6_9ZZZZ